MNILYYLYSLNVGKKNIFSKIFRFILRYVYGFLSTLFYTFKKKDLNNVTNNIVISLTTFPDRIDKTWLVVESLLNQNYKPSKIVLTLSLKQFSGMEALPKKLLQQQKRGLEILWADDDIRSHKKYYYVMKKYPKHIVVTVDDDFLYSKGMLEVLVKFSEQYPDCVIANLAAQKNGNNYKDWKNLLFSRVEPSKEIMQYGGSGVLYPPGILHSDALDKEKILELCPLADDIWLNYMTILNEKKIVKTDYKYYLIPISFKSKAALKNINVGEDMNTIQIKKLNDHYLLKNKA
jgi:hypothetical protein